MDKNAIKKYAVWARRELIARVSQKALRYEITTGGCGDANADSVHGTLLSSAEKKQRQALIARIKEKSYEQVMEEVAYTWFNRFSALRFMEVNGYLPSHVRVFTDEDNNFKPQIITEAIHLELDGLNIEKVYALKDENKTDELYKYLLITQCNALSSILPGMFQRLSDYTELLFPENLLRDGSVIQQMIELIPEDDWKDAVQIIGWLYQYYNSEKKDDVFAALKKNVKITKENIPAATQLFTPDWIVRYMVENSLGRLWVEGHPNDDLKAGWKYYLEEAKQEPEVEEQLAKIRKEYEGLKPEDIKCIDPCCGSGHILAYMFDVLMQIYESYGYTTREAVASIVENNIYGLDIDDRAAQLANFAVMMKARQYDRRFFSHVVQPKVYAIVESNHIDSFTIEHFTNDDVKLEKAIKTVVQEMHDAKEFGSILKVSPQNWDVLYARFNEINDDINMHRGIVLNDLFPLVKVAEALSQKYDVIVTNPPYLSSGGMSAKLANFIKKNYINAKADLYAACMEKALTILKKNRFMAMITMESWMFLPVLEELRKDLIHKSMIESLIHMPYLGKGGTSLGIAFGNCAFIIMNTVCLDFKANYECIRYYETDEEGIPFKFPTVNERIGTQNIRAFTSISSSPIAYWASSAVFEDFQNNDTLEKYIDARSGISTGDNNRFYRCWFECNDYDISFDPSKTPENSTYKWFPIIRGGDFRKWYGNMENVLNLKNGGSEIKNSGNNFRLRTPVFYNKLGITWNRISSRDVSFRLKSEQVNFGENSPCMFVPNNQLYYLMGFLNSKVSKALLEYINSTMTYQVIDIQSIPFIVSFHSDEIDSLVHENILLAKEDWDNYERSWDFTIHPFVKLAKDFSGDNVKLSDIFALWEENCQNRYCRVKKNEELINSYFISLYHLDDSLTPEVDDNDITIRKADRKRDIKSFISYAVGCMFGRYSLDLPGLIYAGGEWYPDKYQIYAADKDNIIPICDDEYFSDDIVGKFINFVKVVFGEDTLQENLEYIAETLGKGTSTEVIRKYFINEFYTDHCASYNVTSVGKRPIYWLFDSGKKGGFKALIYMHRYQQDTIARMRTDYVHEQQARYRTEISDLETRIAGASTSERVKLNKQLSALQDKAMEIRQYEEKIHHLADQMIRIDLDDGVKNNYAIFQDVLAKIK